MLSAQAKNDPRKSIFRVKKSDTQNVPTRIKCLNLKKIMYSF